MRGQRSVVMPLILINVGMFILQIVLGQRFTNALLLDPQDIFVRPWIIITSMFLHGSPNHIFFNMYGLLIFGPLLEEKIGYKRFLLVYFGTGMLAALGHVFFSMVLYGQASPALGASGAIMGMLGTLIILMPNLQLLLFFFIPMPLWTAGILWAVIDFFGVFVPSGIANLAHLAGMGSGLLYGLYLKQKKGGHQRRFERRGLHMSTEDLEEYLKYGKL